MAHSTSRLCLLLVTTALAAMSASAALSPADFLITSLPGLQTPPTFKHYAGYMPAGSDSGGTSLFFWFVESQRDPQRDPVFLWMNGGPGSSSIAYGFWTEHGPWRLVNQSGSVYPVPYDYSWNRIANVLYIEAPSGVGYSYSNDSAHYHTNDPQTSEDNYQFLLNWFAVFSDFKANDFYITGESYGGHYVPTLAERVLDGSATNGINMKGFVIGNPGIQSDWYYNVDEYAFLTFLWSHALVPQTEYWAAYQACGWQDFFTDCSRDFTNTTEQCKLAYKQAWAYVPATWDPYNIYAPTCHPTSEEGRAGQKRVHEYTPALKALQERFGVKTSYDPCLNDWTPLYMNRADVQKAIHVDSHLNAWPWPNHPPNWQYGSEMDDISLLFPKFFAKAPQWRILVFSGDADAAVPFMGTQRWMNCQKRPVKKPWRDWYLNKDVAGVAIDWDRFTFMTIKGCGHTVPTYCPEAGFVFLDKWMTGDY